MRFQVALRMESDIAYSPALSPDAQGNLLAHRPARHKDRGLFPQQRCNFAFEASDDVSLPITVGLQLRVGRLCKLAENLPGSPRILMRQKAATGLEDLLCLGGIEHAFLPFPLLHAV